MDKFFVLTSKWLKYSDFGLNIPFFFLENLDVLIGEFDFFYGTFWKTKV
jgi:hypothetical protein